MAAGQGLCLVGAAVVYTAVAHIEATPDEIFDVLVGFDEYADWNPWLIQAEGEAVVGDSVTATVVLGDSTRTARHRVLEVDAPNRLCWRDAGVTTWFVKGRRCRIVEAEGAGGFLRNELQIWGLFAWLANKKYGDALLEGISAETAAVKARAEGR